MDLNQNYSFINLLHNILGRKLTSSHVNSTRLYEIFCLSSWEKFILYPHSKSVFYYIFFSQIRGVDTWEWQLRAGGRDIIPKFISLNSLTLRNDVVNQDDFCDLLIHFSYFLWWKDWNQFWKLSLPYLRLNINLIGIISRSIRFSFNNGDIINNLVKQVLNFNTKVCWVGSVRGQYCSGEESTCFTDFENGCNTLDKLDLDLDSAGEERLWVFEFG